mmetsp:Transcript_10505/g.12925  ORF Transcript_10505/g.12925 Transcript_10505/m.12925 type:complete len:812 (+) Transcript_10505:368-2803(+)
MEAMESMSIYSKRKRQGKTEEKVLCLDDVVTKPPSHVSFAENRKNSSTIIPSQALTPKRHCNFIPCPSSKTAKPLFPEVTSTSIFTNEQLHVAINEGSHISRTITDSKNRPNSPPSTPFRFNSFPASLPRVHPRQQKMAYTKTPKFLLRKRPTSENYDDSYELSQDKNISNDTINTSISSISVGSPVSMKRCESPTRWGEESVPVQLFMGEESDEEEEVIGTRLNFNTLLSPDLRVAKSEDHEEVTPIQESKDLKSLPTHDLTHTYDTTRTSSFPSRTSSFPSCSTPPRCSAHSILDQSSITRREKFHYDTSQCSPIRQDDSPPSPWQEKDSLSLSRFSGESSGKNRPMPDMTAFDASMTSSPLKIICPPTPVRTPAWAHNEPHSPYRSDSLITSKILAGCPTFNTALSSFDHSEVDSTEKMGDHRDFMGFSKDPQQYENCAGNCTISFHQNFDVLGQIGSGSFADVYKARCKSTGNLYAIKRKRRQFRGKRDREMALGEVRTMQRLQIEDNNRCQYLLFFVRAWQEDGHFFCQTELCCRDSCRSLVVAVRTGHERYPSVIKYVGNRKLIPQSSIWKICHDVAAGLKHIHSHGMVHYDIKPSNLFFAQDDKLGCICKIGDFGMAGDIGSSEDGQEGDTKYMPQELLSSAVKHPSADLFSFGLTLFELSSEIACELPSEGPRWHEIRNRGDTLELPVERDFEFVRIVRSMINPDKLKRPKAENILTVANVLHAGVACDAFLTAYVKDVQDIDLEKERELVAAQKEANIKRTTPTNSATENGSRVLEYETNWAVRTPTPESFTRFQSQYLSGK